MKSYIDFAGICRNIFLAVEKILERALEKVKDAGGRCE